MADKVRDGSPEDTLARLVALRDQLEAALHGASENMLPQLAGRYQAVVEKIADLAPPDAGQLSKRDELKERRERNHDEGGRPASTPARVAGASGGKRRS